MDSTPSLSDSRDCVSNHYTSRLQLSRLFIVLLNGELLDVKGADIILNVCIILKASIESTELTGSINVY